VSGRIVLASGVAIDLNGIILAVPHRAGGPGFAVGLGLGLQHDFLLISVPAGQHLVVFVNLICEHGAGELGFQLRADQPAQFTRAEFGLETGRGQVLHKGFIDD
jgi:hypothetical protein